MSASPSGHPSPSVAGLRAIGILGGTFDPVHEGHLALAREAQTVLDLESVLFVPNADPPHKPAATVTPAAHREAMVALAIEAEPAFALSRLELERPGPSFAVDTVTELARRSRAEGRPDPWFVMSSEALRGLPSWRQPQRILELCRVAVAPRPGGRLTDAGWVAEHFPDRDDRFAFLPGPELDISSTVIRERCLRGAPIDGLVPRAVADYIADHGLYGPGSGPT